MPKKSTKTKLKAGKTKTKGKQLNEKCDYKTGACEGLKQMLSYDNGGRGKGIIALSNIVNMRNPGKMYHKGFFLRSDATKTKDGKNPGVMLDFCPWCGADLREWLRQAQAEFKADAEAFDKKHPDYDEKRAKAKAEYEKERQEFLDKLDPEVRKALKKLSENQQIALLEAWLDDGRYVHGAPGVHANTIESIRNPERKLVDKGRLTAFGKKVRTAAREIPSGYMI